MFGLRSARGRAILAGVVLIVLLAGVATVAIWRTHDDQQRHHALEHTSAVATALEGTQAQFRREQVAVLSTLLLSGDPGPLDDYHDAAVRVEQALSEARAEALAQGEADELLALDNLTERIGQFSEKVDLALPVLLEADPETALQLATATRSEMWPESEAIVADLEELVEAHESDAAATRAAADRAAATTLWGSSSALAAPPSWWPLVR